MISGKLSFQIVLLGWVTSWLFNGVYAPSSTLLKCECGVSKERRRIVGGRPAKVNIYPWMALIRLNRQIHGSGSVINDRYILTAGHCLSTFDLKAIDIVLGAHDLRYKTTNKTTPVVKPEKFIIHENFQNDDDHDFHDIALIKLKGTIQFNRNIKPICLPPIGSDPSGRVAMIAGWGWTSEEEETVSAVLLEAEVDTISRKECLKESDYTADELLNDNFCAMRKGVDSCHGDSGGPLMAHVPNTNRKMQQLGIVSWGRDCADERSPGVYIKLSVYIQWIMKHTRDARYCSK